MEDYEYKVIPAPVRTVKIKGLKTTAERFAHLMTEALNREAEEGWHFLRAETLPCEERKGLMSRTRSTQVVLVFRRALAMPQEEPVDQMHEAPEQQPVPLQRPDGPALPPIRLGQETGSAAIPSFRAGTRAQADDQGATRREPMLRATRFDEDR